MNGATVDFRRNLLRGIAWDAEDAAQTLQAALKAACRARYNDTSDGRVLIGSLGNGQSVTFALPQEASNYTTAIISGAVSQLYDLYNASVEDLVTDGTNTPTDAQILARMLLLLQPRNSEGVDFSRMTQTGALV